MKGDSADNARVIKNENIPGYLWTDEDVQPAKRSWSMAHYLCCCCCPCLPMWARSICCCLLLVIIILVIVGGVLAALFKVPQIDFNGVTDDPSGLPRFQQSKDSLLNFDINIGLKIGVVNPNIESASFEVIKAIAYYPTAPDQAVGGGELRNLEISSHAITNFTFPFHIRYDATKDSNQRMLLDISRKCGLTGGPKQDLTIQYALTPTIRIVGFPFSITVHNSANFPCPISNGQLSVLGAKPS